MSNVLWFVLGTVVGGILTALAHRDHYSRKGPIQRERDDRAQSKRLESVKRKLRDYSFRADQMYEAVLAERVDIESRPDDQQRSQLRQFNVPDVRAWHAEVQSFIDRELGSSRASAFTEEYRHWDQYDFSDLGFVMSFLGKKKNSVLGLARSVTESDLLAAEDPINLGRLQDPGWQCIAGTILPAMLALLMVAVFELLA